MQTAIRLDPENALAHEWHSVLLGFTGRYEEALATADRALALDPLNPLFVAECGNRLQEAGSHEEALEWYTRALELDDDYCHAHHWLGVAYLRLGRYEEAIPELQESVNLSAFGYGPLGQAYALAGREEDARDILALLDERAMEHYVNPMDYAWVHDGLGDLDTAFAWFEQAFDERTILFAYVPLWATGELQADPRYSDLRERMGL